MESNKENYLAEVEKMKKRHEEEIEKCFEIARMVCEELDKTLTDSAGCSKNTNMNHEVFICFAGYSCFRPQPTGHQTNPESPDSSGDTSMMPPSCAK